MSENTTLEHTLRAQALSFAVQVHSCVIDDDEPQKIVDTAQKFFDFLNGNLIEETTHE